MATNTGRAIANTYKNLLNIDNNNSGVDATLRTVQDGEGTASALQLSQSGVNINGDFYLNGSILTANASALNVASNNSDAITSINAVLSLVSVATSVNAAAITSVSTALETRIASVSALTNVNLAAITSINSAYTSVSAALETRIASVSALTSVNTAAITSINSAYTSVSAALETRIASVSALTSVNTAAITSINFAYTSVSAALETRIAAVSALTSVNLAAITSVSTALETRIAAVSVLTSVNLAAGTSTNTRITNLSATFAASIANYLPLAGGTVTGNVSVSGTLEVKTNVFGNRTSLTDGTSIAVDMATGNHFIVQLGGNRTLEAPTNLQPTQTGSILLIQDGTGSRTLSYNAVWKFPAGTAPTLSTVSGTVDRIDFEVYTSSAVHAVATLDLQ